MNKQLLFLTFILQSCIGLKVLSPSSIAGNYVSASLFVPPIEGYVSSSKSEKGFSITGQLTIADPIDACTPLKNVNASGMIFVTSTGACPAPIKFRNIENAGAIGIVWSEFGNGGVSYVIQSQGISEESERLRGVECFFGDVEIFVKAMLKGEIVIVSFDETGGDYFLASTFWTGGILFSPVIGLIAIVQLGFICWKLRGYILLEKKIQFSFPQVSLALLIISCIQRILFAIDPFFSFGIYSYTIANLFLTGSFVLMVTIDVVTLIFYQDTIQKALSKKIQTVMVMSKKLKILLGFIVAAIWIIELTTSIIRASTYGLNDSIVFSAATYFVVVFLLFVFYLFVGIRFAKMLWNLTKNSEDKDFLKKIYFKIRIIITSAALILLFDISFALFAFGGLNPIGTNILKWILWGCVSGLISLQLSMFASPYKKMAKLSKSSDIPLESLESANSIGNSDRDQENFQVV